MNDLEHLAHAIARIGELDCTRTLPGRLVWYAPQRIQLTAQTLCLGCNCQRYSVDETGRCFTCRAVANGYVPPAPAPSDPTRQGGLEAWPNGER